MSAVIDSSAVLAALNREPGWERAMELIPEGTLLTISFGEVATKLARYIDDREMIAGLIHVSVLDLVNLDADLALEAGLIDPRLVKGWLSLADRCCIAYAKAHAIPAVTADRVWSEIAEPLGVDILQIRD
ncbi:MAG: PIN domain-containing protein [Alphaproteobacteria bacterium]|jgi:PIN domain nuclease of toxin-antitoxin system|nr:PIN domain-containing protein [Alphaproteobacteria bacterium]